MKSVGTRFLIPIGIIGVLSLVGVFYQTYESSRKHAYELISQQAAMALEFNLAIRSYARENILPVMEKLVDKDTFVPETMSTSFISRSIFEKVKKKFPGDIIRFASDNPRNPINRATPDDERMIEYFRQNPQVNRRTGEIQIEGRRYLAHFSPMLMKQECLRCHGDPKDAPAELIKRYGPTASFHRKLGDVVGLDRVAVPVEAINAFLASEMRSRSMILAAVFVLLFGSIFYVFRFVVTKRLVAMASHFDEIAAYPESTLMTPIAIKGNDEIGVVGRAFNKLVEQLRATHASLEQRVGERTEELRHVNVQLQLELTERKHAEEALRKSEGQMRLFYELPFIGMAITSPTKGWVRANDKLCDTLGYSIEELSRMTWVELTHPDDLAADVAQFNRLLAGQIDGYTLDKRFIRKDGAIIFASIAVQCVRHADKTVDYCLALLEDITPRSQAEEKLQESYRKLQETLEETVSALATTVETRDPYTAGHQKRVAQLACAIAREIGLPENQIKALRISGLLHDIGKMSVPAEILSKPGKISEMEFNIIKNHPEVSYNIVKEIRFPCNVAESIAQHHERLDGSGYPKGLAGSEIVLEARILAVADVVEAMVSHRPYRQALGIDAALDEVTKNKGILYDPEVVEVCVRLFREKGFTFE